MYSTLSQILVKDLNPYPNQIQIHGLKKKEVIFLCVFYVFNLFVSFVYLMNFSESSPLYFDCVNLCKMV